MANEQIIDTFVPELFGFETPTTTDRKLVTGSGVLYLSGRPFTVPSLSYTYAPSKETYDDVILSQFIIGTGDGSTKTFTATLTSKFGDIVFTTLDISDGKSKITDIPKNLLDSEDPNFESDALFALNKDGVLRGDGSGSINYESGKLTVTFDTAPASGIRVRAEFLNVQHTPVTIGAVAPHRPAYSTRLQKVTTDEDKVTSVEKLAKSEWDRHTFLAGRSLQSRELNEAISVNQALVRKLANTIFDDGDIITGSQIFVNPTPEVDTEGVTTYKATISDGLVYLYGAIREVPETVLSIKGVGEELIGLRIIRTFVTEDQDPNLRDPATGFDGTGLPGAWREKMDVQWRLDDEEAAPVFRLQDGNPLIENPSTVFSDINRVLARRTFDESGNYRVNGFTGSTRPATELASDGVTELKDDLNLFLDVDGGSAYVQGFDVRKPVQTRIDLKRANDTSGVTDTFTYKPSGSPDKLIYDPGRKPLAKVTKVSGLARTPEISISGGGGGAGTVVDLPTVGTSSSSYKGIPSDSAKARILIYNTSTADGTATSTYVEDTDWSLNSSGDSITWTNNEPSGTYYAYWNYNTDNEGVQLVKGERILATATDESVATSGHGTAANLANKDVVKILTVKNNAGTATYVENVDYTFTTGKSSTAAPTFGTITTLATGRITASSTLKVTYQYWDHATEGDYLGPDSYLEQVENGYVTRIGTSNKYRYAYELLDDDQRNNVDFRVTASTSLSTTANWTSAGQGSAVDQGYETTIKYDHYLPRMDSVVLTKDGELKVIYGEASARVRPPDTPAESLRLLQIYSKPYTLNPTVKSSTTTRSTMEDIQQVKRRLDDLEVEVATTALEEDAITAAQTFLLRGIYTDPFTSFDFMDLAYDKLADRAIPDAWATGTYYNVGQTVRSLTYNATLSVYFRCIQAGTSAGSDPFSGATAGSVVTDNTAKWFAFRKPAPTVRANTTAYVIGDTVSSSGADVFRTYYKCVVAGTSGGSDPTTINDLPGQRITDGTVTWEVYAADDDHVKHNIAISNLASAARLQNLHSVPSTPLRSLLSDSTGAYIGQQILMMEHTLRRVIRQNQATQFVAVNPYDTFEPVMNVSLEPSADFWVDTNRTSPIEVNLPGSSRTNLSVGYTHDPLDEASRELLPVHPLPEEYPLGYIDDWEGQFHVGVPVDFSDIPVELTPGAYTDTDFFGNQSVFLNDSGDIDTWGVGFVPKEIRVTTNTQTQSLGTSVVSSNLSTYARGGRKVTVKGELFPLETDITCTFAGKNVALTEVVGDGVSGKVRAVSNPNSSDYGSFTATFVTPYGVKGGSIPVEVKAGADSRIVSYISQGTISVTQESLVSITSTSYDVIGAMCPVAQTFIPPESGHLRKLDLYFYSKDSLKGVEVQIRNVVNGYPGQTVFAKTTLTPQQVVTSENASLATEVYFKDPAFVLRDKEYSIVILDDSDQYRIWVATLGQKDIVTKQMVTKQGDIGVFFKSANNKTWTADQYSDLKYSIWFAEPKETSITLNFDETDGIMANRLLLNSTQFVPFDPTGAARIRWSASLDGGSNYFPVRPKSKQQFSTVFDKVRLRVQLTAGVLDGKKVSPFLNLDHLGISGSAMTGEDTGPYAEYPNMIEANYIGEDLRLSQSYYKDLKIVLDEYKPSGSYVRAWYSTDSGDTWLAFPNSDAEEVSGVSDYQTSSFGGDISEVIRTVKFNEITTPAAPTLVQGTGGPVAHDDYWVRYSLLSEHGESVASPAATINIGGGSHSIEFDLPSGTAWPEDPAYNSNKPVNVTGVRVYLYRGTAEGPTKLLADSSYSATIAAAGTVVISSEELATPEVSPPTVGNALPYKFKTRLQLLAPLQKHLADNPTEALDSSPQGTGIGAVSGVAKGGSFSAGTTYKIYYSYVTAAYYDASNDGSLATYLTTKEDAFELEETIADPTGVSITLASGENAFELTDYLGDLSGVSVLFENVPEQVVGLRFYAKDASDTSTERPRLINGISVMRGDVLTSTNTVLRDDLPTAGENSFFLKNNPTDGAINEQTHSPETNQTPPLTAVAPQVSRLRVIAHDAE